MRATHKNRYNEYVRHPKSSIGEKIIISRETLMLFIWASINEINYDQLENTMLRAGRKQIILVSCARLNEKIIKGCDACACGTQLKGASRKCAVTKN